MIMCHVLIIEDDWLIADHVAQLVEEAGAVSTDFADTEDDAVRQAAVRPPAIIISDVTLRIGTGPAAIDRIVAAHGPIPVMFVTGEPRSFRPRDPAMFVLHKPVDDRLLVQTFRSLALLH